MLWPSWPVRAHLTSLAPSSASTVACSPISKTNPRCKPQRRPRALLTLKEAS
jgi:hypothetical protein